MSAITATRARRSADLVLPGAAYAEKHGTYVNIEGRVQRSERAAFPPGDAREDWTIFRALVRPHRQAAAVRPLRPAPRGDDRRGARAWAGRASSTCRGRRRSSTPRRQGPVGYPIKDFYLTNAICRASPTMRRCSEELVQGREYLEAAE